MGHWILLSATTQVSMKVDHYRLCPDTKQTLMVIEQVDSATIICSKIFFLVLRLVYGNVRNY